MKAAGVDVELCLYDGSDHAFMNALVPGGVDMLKSEGRLGCPQRWGIRMRGRVVTVWSGLRAGRLPPVVGRTHAGQGGHVWAGVWAGRLPPVAGAACQLLPWLNGVGLPPCLLSRQLIAGRAGLQYLLVHYLIWLARVCPKSANPPLPPLPPPHCPPPPHPHTHTPCAPRLAAGLGMGVPPPEEPALAMDRIVAFFKKHLAA